MDRVIRNYEEPLAKPASFKQYFAYVKHKRLINKLAKIQNKIKPNQTEHNHDHSHENIQNNVPPKDIKIISLAIVVDDIVVDILNTQEGLADVLLKNPKFILIKEGEHRPHQGSVYKDNKFTPFEEIVAKIAPTSRG